MSAVISPCGKYRYRLDRSIEAVEKEIIIAFFGINPSTADAVEDDQTIRKLRTFTRLNGGSYFIMGNVFAYRATQVFELQTVRDPVGPRRDHYLKEIIKVADLLVPCWGATQKLIPRLRDHVDEVEIMLRCAGKPVKCFGKTQTGDPKHPLRLAYATKLVPL